MEICMTLDFDFSIGTSRRAFAIAGMLALLAGCVVLDVAAQAPPAAAKLTRERINEIVASPDRSDADRTNDVRRKPAEMPAFIGIVPGMVAVDLSTLMFNYH